MGCWGVTTWERLQENAGGAEKGEKSYFQIPTGKKTVLYH